MRDTTFGRGPAIGSIVITIIERPGMGGQYSKPVWHIPTEKEIAKVLATYIKSKEGILFSRFGTFEAKFYRKNTETGLYDHN